MFGMRNHRSRPHVPRWKRSESNCYASEESENFWKLFKAALNEKHVTLDKHRNTVLVMFTRQKERIEPEAA